MIPAERFVDVAKAIETALVDHNPIGIPFEHDAKVFIAAWNSCEAIARDGVVAPTEFSFASETLTGGSPPGIAPTVAASNVLTFSAQPKDGDGFNIGKTRYQFHATAKGALRNDIVIGADLPATIAATVLAINGPSPKYGDPLVTAASSAPDAITIVAKELGEPLLPIRTVTWSKVLSDEEKALAERKKIEDEAAAVKPQMVPITEAKLVPVSTSPPRPPRDLFGSARDTSQDAEPVNPVPAPPIPEPAPAVVVPSTFAPTSPPVAPAPPLQV
jgi:hypothetical protein